MKFTPSKINAFLAFKLPSAFISGVRVSALSEEKAIVRVKHRWINQNPFRSLYWATQGMASELATGILMMQHIDKSKQPISMLVASQTGSFSKKATGKIIFECDEGEKVKQAIAKAIETKEGQLLELTSKGFDNVGDEVSSFTYQWTIKLKQPKK